MLGNATLTIVASRKGEKRTKARDREHRTVWPAVRNGLMAHPHPRRRANSSMDTFYNPSGDFRAIRTPPPEAECPAPYPVQLAPISNWGASMQHPARLGPVLSSSDGRPESRLLWCRDLGHVDDGRPGCLVTLSYSAYQRGGAAALGRCWRCAPSRRGCLPDRIGHRGPDQSDQAAARRPLCAAALVAASRSPCIHPACSGLGAGGAMSARPRRSTPRSGDPPAAGPAHPELTAATPRITSGGNWNARRPGRDRPGAGVDPGELHFGIGQSSWSARSSPAHPYEFVPGDGFHRSAWRHLHISRWLSRAVRPEDRSVAVGLWQTAMRGFSPSRSSPSRCPLPARSRDRTRACCSARFGAGGWSGRCSPCSAPAGVRQRRSSLAGAWGPAVRAHRGGAQPRRYTGCAIAASGSATPSPTSSGSPVAGAGSRSTSWVALRRVLGHGRGPRRLRAAATG